MFFFRVDWYLDTYFLQIWVVSSLGYFSWILWGSGTHNIYRLTQVIQVYQQQEKYTIKFLHETAPPSPPRQGTPPGICIFFLSWRSISLSGHTERDNSPPLSAWSTSYIFCYLFWSVQKQNDLFSQLLWTLSWVYWEKDNGCHNVVKTWTINLKTNYLWRRKTLKNASLIEH